jgi:hypothetical protein
MPVFFKNFAILEFTRIYKKQPFCYKPIFFNIFLRKSLLFHFFSTFAPVSFLTLVLSDSIVRNPSAF